MKKIKLGSVEFLGYLGMIIWGMIVILRDMVLLDNEIYLFFLNTFPNLAATWVAVMLGKWILLFKVNKEIIVKRHLILCILIFVLALISEIVHALFLNSPFDIYDMLVTVVALCIIFLIPIIMKDRDFDMG